MLSTGSLEVMSSEAVVASRQYNWWRDTVSGTHYSWDMPRRDELGFKAKVRRQALGAADIIHCVCDPCRGRRSRVEIGRSSDAAYGLLYVIGGRERITHGGREAELGPGDLTLWDSTKPMEFLVPDSLQKITLLLPQRLLEAVLPNVRDLTGTVLNGRSGCGAIFATHLRALARQAAELPSAGREPVLRATLELLVTAIDPMPLSVASDYHKSMLARITGHILQRLGDPELNPDGIATAVGISPRQLHRVFGESGWTVERWIWHRRLEACRHDLALRPAARISQIAYHWGFSDAAHFSRAFREAYGTSPRLYRATTLEKKANPTELLD